MLPRPCLLLLQLLSIFFYFKCIFSWVHISLFLMYSLAQLNSNVFLESFLITMAKLLLPFLLSTAFNSLFPTTMISKMLHSFWLTEVNTSPFITFIKEHQLCTYYWTIILALFNRKETFVFPGARTFSWIYFSLFCPALTIILFTLILFLGCPCLEKWYPF